MNNNSEDTIYFLGWALKWIEERIPKTTTEKNIDDLITLKMAQRHLKEIVDESSGTNREDRIE